MFAAKDGDTQKEHAMMEGSKCATTWLHKAVKTYASCIEPIINEMFFAIAAVMNKIITAADTINAFQQSPHQNPAFWRSMKHTDPGSARNLERT